MLRPQIVVLVALGFLARQDDDLPALIRESFEPPASFGGPELQWNDGSYRKSRAILSVKRRSVKAARDSRQHLERAGDGETKPGRMSLTVNSLARTIRFHFFRSTL